MNFGRVVRMAIRYKLTFVASIFSALIVAVLWGGNIGTLYPVVEVVFQNQTMQQWIDGKIEHSRETVAEKSAKVERLNGELDAAADADRRKIEANLANTESELAAETRALDWYEYGKPYIDQYLPTDPFHMLALITGLLLAGTIIKDVFLVLNNILVSRLAQLATFDLRNMFYRRTLRMDLATFSEGRHGRPDEPLHKRYDPGGQRTGVVVRQAHPRAAQDGFMSGAGRLHLLAAADRFAGRRAVGGLSCPLARPHLEAG